MSRTNYRTNRDMRQELAKLHEIAADHNEKKVLAQDQVKLLSKELKQADEQILKMRREIEQLKAEIQRQDIPAW